MPNDPAPYISKRSIALRESSKEAGARGRLQDLPEITLESVRADAHASHLATEVQSIISAGKEATVFLAFWRDFPLALKVYRYYSTPHGKRGKRKKMGGGKVGFSKDIMAYWAAREFWILERAFRAGVNVPTPARHSDNMFTARFLGEDLQPAPLLKDVDIKHPKRIFDKIIEQVFTLYRVFLIHGDLSAFNILMFQDEPWIIDFPQAIDFASRPGRHSVVAEGRPILLRDIKNICRFFSRFGVNADAEVLCNECMSQVGETERLEASSLVR
ncbi:MAG: RIO1 family regulatory kinase/ATPase [Promethearchaeota archaeon]